MEFFINPAFVVSAMTVFFGFFFGAVVIYTFLIKSRKSCDEAANLPLRDEASDYPPQP